MTTIDPLLTLSVYTPHEEHYVCGALGAEPMSRCEHEICKDCTCGRKATGIYANANFTPVEKPKQIVRRGVRSSAAGLEKRFKESMKILA